MHQHSLIDELSNDFLDDYVALDPLDATQMGIDGYQSQLPDFSPEGTYQRVELARSYKTKLLRLSPKDEIDRASVSVLQERLDQIINFYEAGLLGGELNNIDSPVQHIRDSFELMSTNTLDDRYAIIARIDQIPAALEQYQQSLDRRLVEKRSLFPRLQVQEVINQAHHASSIIAACGTRFSAAERDNFDKVITKAGKAFDDLSNFLKDKIGPYAVEDNAVGIDHYRLYSRKFLGASIDLAESYQWGLDFLDSVVTEQKGIVDTFLPGKSIPEAFSFLDQDPQYTVHGTESLQAWMQELSDSAVSELAKEHFDIPEKLRSLQCCISDSGTGGVYYTSPSEDFSRPGRMWWSVPPAVNTFHTWQETTTVFHEGVPGHHLQLGTALISSDLNRFRKLASFISGHGEGWALYAERLMDELGWLSEPGERLGMLDAQCLRAARVVVDIGVHCRFPAPLSVGGGPWTYEKAWHFLRAQLAVDDANLRFELHRYLGWPGQAPSYAIGQRIWLQLREKYLALHSGATVKDFHTHALALGGIGLEALQTHVLAQ